jgi:hypothetical protein
MADVTLLFFRKMLGIQMGETLGIQRSAVPVGLGAETGCPSKKREERRRRLPSTPLAGLFSASSSFDLPRRARYENAINGDSTPMERAHLTGVAASCVVYPATNGSIQENQ